MTDFYCDAYYRNNPEEGAFGPNHKSASAKEAELLLALLEEEMRLPSAGSKAPTGQSVGYYPRPSLLSINDFQQLF